MTLKSQAYNANLADAMVTLANIMAALRHPDTGCPWDIEQTPKSIAPYTLEEAYEVVDAIEEGDPGELRDELGDLLLQVVFHAQMASENAQFTLTDVARSISDKMVRRHPHVFDGDNGIQNAEDQTRSWEAIKAAERSAKPKAKTSALDGIAGALPALMRAEKLQKRAARVGFDWPDAAGAKGKLMEEVAELDAAVAQGEPEAVLDEAGDLLFSCVNYLRKLGVSADDALRHANRKFEGRFKTMETDISAAGQALEDADLTAMEAAWQRAKG